MYQNRNRRRITCNHFLFLKISIVNLEQPKRCLARKVARLMPFSTNPTFEMEKLKKRASEVHQKLDGYTYEKVLLAVGFRQDSQSYVRQMQRAQIFVQQMTTAHQLSSKVTNFYSKQNWATHDLKKVVDHMAKLLNVESKRKF